MSETCQLPVASCGICLDKNSELGECGLRDGDARAVRQALIAPNLVIDRQSKRERPGRTDARILLVSRRRGETLSRAEIDC